MTTKSAEVAWSNLAANPGWLATAASGGALAGVAGRGLRNLFDLHRDATASAPIPETTAPRAELPVEVTPEEAEELKRQGVHVKTAAPTFIDQMALGGVATLGAGAGWWGANKFFEGQRLSDEQSRLDDARKRLRGLLSGQPQPQDAALGGVMKAAEEVYFKSASFLGNLIGQPVSDVAATVANSIPGAIPYAAGAGLTLSAVGAFNEARKRSKARMNQNAITEYAREQPVQPAQVELEPVLRKTAALKAFLKAAASAANTLSDGPGGNYAAQTAPQPASWKNTLTDRNFDAQTENLPAAPKIPFQPSQMGKEQVIDSSANPAYERAYQAYQKASTPPPAARPAGVYSEDGRSFDDQAQTAAAPAAPPAAPAAAPAPSYTGGRPLIFPVQGQSPGQASTPGFNYHPLGLPAGPKTAALKAFLDAEPA